MYGYTCHKIQLGSQTGSVPPLASCTSDMNAVIIVYGALLTARKEASRPPPVICINYADVLMDWYEGDSTMPTDIKALLTFFVQVRTLHVAAHHCM